MGSALQFGDSLNRSTRLALPSNMPSRIFLILNLYVCDNTLSLMKCTNTCTREYKLVSMGLKMNRAGSINSHFALN